MVIQMTVDNNTMKKLRALEKEDVRLINERANLELEINGILMKFQKIRIESWDGSGLYEDGRHVINAPAEKVEPIKEIESGHKGNFVSFKAGTSMKLEEYFTPEEVDSIRKY